MANVKLTRGEKTLIKSIVSEFDAHLEQIKLCHEQLLVAIKGSNELRKHVHSIRSRLKDRDHLIEKLERKLRKCKVDGREFPITPRNLLERVNDLVGVRLLHLHTRQFTDIDRALRGYLMKISFELIEEPFARTWDDESRRFFKECNIQTQDSPSMYTSVHYVISSASRTVVTAEIQVRTLMEKSGAKSTA